MAVYTYQLKVGGQTVTAKAKKDVVQRLNNDLSHLNNIRSWTRTLYGVIGQEERQSEAWLLVGVNGLPLPDPEGYEADKAALFQEILNAPQPLSKDACLTFAARAVALRKKHMAVKDERRTPEEQAEHVAQSNAVAAEWDAKRATERAAFLNRFAENSGEIAWGDGEMAVFLDMVYDDSDPMTDYFSPHASWGSHLLLDVVPKSAETERVARAVVAKYPDLAKMVFEWKTEKWAMGHGNYLTSVGRRGQARDAVEAKLAAMPPDEVSERFNSADEPSDELWQEHYDYALVRSAKRREMMAEAEAAVEPGTYPDVIAEGVTTYGGYRDPEITYEIRFQSWPGKMAPYKGYTAAQSAAPAAQTAPAGDGLLYIQPDFHDKRGVPIWLVKLNERVDRDAYNRYASLALRFNARWSSWGPKSKHGFVFFDQKKAEEFVAQATS